MFSKKPKHVIGRNENFEISFQNGGLVVTTADRKKVVSTYSSKDLINDTVKSYIAGCKEEGAGLDRYKTHFKTRDELVEQYKALSAKIDEISKVFETEINVERYYQLINNTYDNLAKHSKMNEQTSHDVAIHAALKQTIATDTKEIVRLHNIIKSIPPFPLIQDFENKLNAYETTLKNMPKPTTAYETSLLEDCMSWSDLLKGNLTAKKQSMDVQNELCTKLINIVENFFIKIRNAKSPRNGSNQNSNTPLYSPNQTYTPGRYQPAPSKTGAIDSLAQQTATMNISHSTGSSP